MRIKYYEDAKENAAFERCTDAITNMIIKYGPLLKRKWAVEEWLRNIHAGCCLLYTSIIEFLRASRQESRVCSNIY